MEGKMTEQCWDAGRHGCQTGLTGLEEKRGQKWQRLNARRAEGQKKDENRPVCVLCSAH